MAATTAIADQPRMNPQKRGEAAKEKRPSKNHFLWRLSGHRSALTAAAPWGGRGCDTRSIQMSLDRRCEHVCPIRFILVICLDEERHKRCSIDIQTLVVPKEEAPSIRCVQYVEGGRGDARLVPKARTMVGRRREPVV